MRKRMLSQGTIAAIFIAASSYLQAARAEPQSSATWQMSGEAKTEWLQTLKILAPSGDWKISNSGNDFVIEAAKPVYFQYWLPNSPPGERPRKIKIPTKSHFRVTLRFSPLLAKTQWQDKKSRDDEVEKQHHALLRKYKISQKFDQFSLSGNDAQERAVAYRVEAGKLKSDLLPQLFSLDYSITTFESWPFLFRVDEETAGQKEYAEECKELLNRMRRLFGTYEPSYAQNDWYAYDEKYRTQMIYPVELRIFGK